MLARSPCFSISSKFFKVSAWRNFPSRELSGINCRKVFLSSSFGNLGIGISISVSSLVSVLVSALQKNHFCLQKVFWTNKIFMFFLVFRYGIKTALLQILISLQFSIHSSKSVPWRTEASVHWCFEKITAPKRYAYFLAKHPGWIPFQVHIQAFLGFFQKTL